MRTFFWFAVAIGLAFLVLGLLVFGSPEINGVLGHTLDDWYSEMVWWGALAGAAIGASFAYIVRRRLPLSPRVRGEAYISRVIGYGLWGIIASTIFVVAVIGIAAALNTLLPFPPLTRAVQLVAALKFSGILGAGIVGGAASYTLGTRYGPPWAGQYALIPLNPFKQIRA
jgi:hypothetical protein